MPTIKNEYYLQFMKEGLIELVNEEQLQEWLEEVPNQKKPKKCSNEQAKTLLTIVYYSGARPSELADLCSKHFNKNKYERTRVYELTLETLKGGIKRVIPIPVNPETTKAFNYAKKLYPEAYLFASFRHLGKNSIHWVSKKEVYVRENGVLTKENLQETKNKTYFRKGHKINDYITLWTGRPSYFFRHNRFSIMANKGASDQQIQFVKGSKSIKSVEPYKHLSSNTKKKLMKYF